MVEFDQLIREKRDTDAVRYLAKEYYNNGKMGHTRKMLLERIADKCDNLSSQLAEAQDKACEHLDITETFTGVEPVNIAEFKYCKPRNDLEETLDRLAEAQADNVALLNEFDKLLKYDSLSWLHDHFKQIILINRSGADLLKELEQLRRAVDIAARITSCVQCASREECHRIARRRPACCAEFFLAQAKAGGE